MGTVIGAIVFGILTVACFVFSGLQFHERGFLFNNAYIYASKQEREAMDKKPYYRQSGLVFLLIGLCFLMNTLEMILQTGWLFYGVIALAAAAIAYAIVSSLRIAKKKK